MAYPPIPPPNVIIVPNISLDLDSGEDYVTALALQLSSAKFTIGGTKDFLYAGLGTSPAKLVKIEVATDMIKKGTLALAQDGNCVSALAIIGNSLYVGLAGLATGGWLPT
jgi:hypothetical protein